jgi:serine/threonine protein kinase
MAEPLRRVGRYDLLEVIGRGGAAVVYLAYQPDLDRQVALKELAPHHAADPSFARRFVEESRLAASLSSPGITTVFEYFEHEGLPYIAMEYMPHGSLRNYVQDLNGAQLGGVLESVLLGLAYGERAGIVHRDLKPENILVGANGRVKIADFGVARALTTSTPRPFATVTGTPIGTPAYMAPEQALGQPLTPATDLYSLGIITWEALAGRTPFGSSDTPMAVLYQQVNEPIPPIETIRDDMHPGACRWLARMLAKDPEQRYASALEAWDELEDVLLEMLGPRWRREAALDVSDASAPDTARGRSSEFPQADSAALGPGVPTAFSVLGPPQTEPDDLDSRLDMGTTDFEGRDVVEALEALNRLESPDGVDSGADADDELRISDDRPRPQISAVLTPDPQNAPFPELDPLLAILPTDAVEPARDDLQALRAAAAPERRRTRTRPASTTRLLAAGSVVVIAAAAGALIGSAASPGPAPTPAPITTTAASDRDALEVRPIIAALSSGPDRAISSFDAAKTLKAQAAAALLVSDRYAAAETRLASARVPAGSRAAVAGVEFDLSDLSEDWRTVAADASHDRRTKYAAAARIIRATQQRLARDAALAERG